MNKKAKREMEDRLAEIREAGVHVSPCRSEEERLDFRAVPRQSTTAEKLPGTVPYTRDGKRVIGTLETLEGCAFVERKAGDGEILYDGETKVYWDTQTTVERDGQRVWLDEWGNEVLETEIDWRRETEQV